MRRALVVFLIAAAFGGCTCSKRETKVSSIDGAVKATIKQVDRTQLTLGVAGGGHVGIIYPTTEDKSACVLEVEKPQKFTARIDSRCLRSRYEMAGAPDATMLAYRPDDEGDGSWHVVYFGKGDRSFDAPEVVASPSPFDFSKVPPLDTVLEPLYRQQPSILVLDEVRARRGEDGLADVLIRLATVDDHATDVHGKDCGLGESAWEKAYAGLSAPAKARVGAALLPVLADADATPEQLRRVLLVADLDAAEVVARTDALLERGVSPDVWGVLLLRLGARDRAKAAKAACDRLTRADARFTGPDANAAFAVLGDAGFSCDAMSQVGSLRSTYCREDAWFCGEEKKLFEKHPFPRKLCPPSVAQARVAAIVHGTQAEARAFVCDDKDGNVAMTTALRASKAAVDAHALVGVERQAYAVVMPKAPLCIDLPPSAEGTPCAIAAGLGDEILCGFDDEDARVITYLPSGNSAPVGRLEIDDAKRQVSLVRSDYEIPAALLATLDASAAPKTTTSPTPRGRRRHHHH
jgi:hypothetical protein